MKVEGEYLFDGARQLVWETLLDPAVLASVLPGCEKLEKVGDNEYEGALKLRIGPVQGDFVGRVRLENLRPPDAYTMQVDGRGAPGFVKAIGHLALTGEGDRTRVKYEGDAQVGGRLASVGQRLVESSAKAIIKQSLDGLNAAVTARARDGAGAPSRTPSVDPFPVTSTGTSTSISTTTKPSQSQFAIAVAREVAKDLVPKPVRFALAAAALIVVLLIAYALLT